VGLRRCITHKDVESAATELVPLSTLNTERVIVPNAPVELESQSSSIRHLTRRVQAEYAEMPGLNVTLEQAERLLNIDRPTCAVVFTTLIEQGVLRRTAQGTYVRA
jgi:hypothetical protein